MGRFDTGGGSTSAGSSSTSQQFQLLAETVLAGVGTFEVSGLSQDFKDLLIVGGVRSTEDDEVDIFNMRMGSGTVDSGATDYHFHQLRAIGDAGSNLRDYEASLIQLGVGPSDQADAGAMAYFEVKILNYASTSTRKLVDVRWTAEMSATRYRSYDTAAVWNNTSDPVDIIEILPEIGPNFVAGSFLRVYGVGGSPLT